MKYEWMLPLSVLLFCACQDAELSPGATHTEALPRAATFSSADAEEAGRVVAEPEDEARIVFDPEVVRTYELTIDPLVLSLINLLPSAELEVPAELTVDGETFAVGARYKGSVGAFLAPCTKQTAVGPSLGQKVGKCSMKIDFDAVDKDRRFHGLKKLNFHSMGKDPSLMRERLGYALYRQMGVAAPRAVHARLVINGKLEGVFLAVEQLDGRFTKSRFTDGGNGNLYKEVWPTSDNEQRYRAALQTNKGELTDVHKMIGFKRAIDEGADAALGWVDRDYMMRYLAVDRVIMNDDGAMHWYCWSNHNYFWYESQRAERMWLIPWDLDSSLAPASWVHIMQPWWKPTTDCSCGGVSGSAQRAPSCDRLTGMLGGLRDEYEAKVDELLGGPFSAEAVDAELAAWSRQIAPLVEEAAGVLGAPDADTWRQKLDDLRGVVASARAHRGFHYDDEAKDDGASEGEEDAPVDVDRDHDAYDRAYGRNDVE